MAALGAPASSATASKTARAARRMADRAVQQLHDDARAATPVAKPLPGHDEALWVQRRGRRPGKAREAWKRSSIDRSVSPAGQPRFEGEAFNDDPLIELIEYPTRPHVIRPRLDRMMADGTSNAANAWTQKPRGLRQTGTARLMVPLVGGGFAYPREVHHPGTEGVHMMRNALAQLDATFASSIGQVELDRWAKEQLGG